jgi:hypothetical protein
MSELDDLRIQNKELKRLLGNALQLLEKSKLALTRQAQVPQRATGKKTATKPPRKTKSLGKQRVISAENHSGENSR